MSKFLLRVVAILTINISFGVEPKIESSISAGSQDAIKQTQELLKNPANLQGNAEASKLFELMGNNPNANQDLSNTTASIFADLAAKTGGDPEKLRKLLEEAKKNPEAFANQLSPEQKKAISNLATQIEDNNNKKMQIPQSQK
jgi:hypothetical protein